mmetsp:Transcript_30293/g.64159  ORF Transcript_30293/g.64159 Transcript_30293/m.64159 type:complete len:252 (-) Transcript_30293:662-1417(-)
MYWGGHSITLSPQWTGAHSMTSDNDLVRISPRCATPSSTTCRAFSPHRHSTTRLSSFCSAFNSAYPAAMWNWSPAIPHRGFRSTGPFTSVLSTWGCALDPAHMARAVGTVSSSHRLWNLTRSRVSWRDSGGVPRKEMRLPSSATCQHSAAAQYPPNSARTPLGFSKESISSTASTLSSSKYSRSLSCMSVDVAWGLLLSRITCLSDARRVLVQQTVAKSCSLPSPTRPAPAPRTTMAWEAGSRGDTSLVVL